MAPLQVALISPPLDASGGIGRVMTYTLAALSREESRVEVIDTRGHSSDPRWSLFPLLHACWRIVALRLLGRVDVAHVNISSYGSTLRKAAVVLTCHLLRVPVVLHLHAGTYPQFFDPLPEVAKSWVRRVFASAQTVVVLTDTWGRYACAELHVREDRVLVLPNAAPGPQALVPRRRSDREPLRLLFLGRLSDHKGVPELLDALASPAMRCRSWVATLAGDGDVDSYSERVNDKGLTSRVDLPGWVTPEGAHQLLSAAHVLVLPSHVEGLPMAVVEAFAWGVPVISTPVGGIPEIVTDRVNGLLTPVGDVAALTEALLRLLDDEPMRLRLARDARNTWERSYAIAPYSRRLLDEWQRVGRWQESSRPARRRGRG